MTPNPAPTTNLVVRGSQSDGPGSFLIGDLTNLVTITANSTSASYIVRAHDDHVRDRVSFREAARYEIVPRWYRLPPQVQTLGHDGRLVSR